MSMEKPKHNPEVIILGIDAGLKDAGLVGVDQQSIEEEVGRLLDEAVEWGEMSRDEADAHLAEWLDKYHRER